MKRIIKWFVPVIFIMATACGSEEDTPVCASNSVDLFNKSFTRFVFSRNADNAAELNEVRVHDGTDSSYTYTYTHSAGVLTNVAQSEDGTIINYNVTNESGKVSRFTSKTSTGANKDEIRFIYDKDQVNQTQVWMANEAGTFFQVGHQAYTYDGSGDLTNRKTSIDLASLFSVAFGVDPTDYSPLVFDEVSYEPSNVTNPLKGHYFIDNFDLALMSNTPDRIIYSNSTETYSIEKDGSGLMTKSTSGSKYIKATYICQ